MGYEFEWDPIKAAANLRDHGISFEEATTVFADPLAMLLTDPDHSVDEERYVLLGESTQRNLLVIAFADRPPRTRLSSAREATPHERRQYEESES
ncbi:MAG: BrnT family toxin [Candidatus Binatia bacterium]